jgi:hypothetical protein
MAEERKIKDSARAIDATAMIKRARRQAISRLIWQIVGWLVVIVIVVLVWKGLSAILDYAALEEVDTTAPRTEEPAQP